KKIALEALKAGVRPEVLSSTPEFLSDMKQADIYYKLKQVSKDSFIVSEKLLRRFCETEEPQGIAFLAAREKHSPEKALAGVSKRSITVLLEGINDPGNYGAIIRTCLAAGVGTIITSKGSVSKYNPKVIRATMGAIFRTNIVEGVDFTEYLTLLKNHGVSIVATDLKAKECFWDAKIELPVALVFGNETHGISQTTLEQSDLRVKLPITGDIDSLNLSVSAGILIFDLVRRFKLL
ncbi:MAG: RNA methyltransferase, partial [Candidatus Firestonebacteria bacterium]